jgi:ElaB/YqjD/DUF883 family membrane-anchored ribosome-binding protein
MTTTSTDPREIEADLERERSRLASTLDALSDRVSVDNLAKEALGYIRGGAGTATVAVDRVVRASPLGVALVGAGVAWMLIGPRLRGGSSSDDRSRSDWSRSPAPVHGSAGSTSYGAYGSASAGGAYGAYGTYGSSSSQDTGSWGEDRAWAKEAHSLRERAMAALHRLEEEARSYLGGARDFAAERAAVVSGFASDLKARLGAGLEGLSEDSREQVMAARERAYAAMLKAERMGAQAIREPGRMMEEHPFVAGAIAFAAGAALGALLPRTDAEDRAFGAERDRLLDEATRLFNAEKARAMQIAGSLTEEIKTVAAEAAGEIKAKAAEVATEAAHTMADTASQKAEEAAQRLAERADDEVSRIQNEGRSGGPVVG